MEWSFGEEHKMKEKWGEKWKAKHKMQVWLQDGVWEYQSFNQDVKISHWSAGCISILEPYGKKDNTV